MRLFSRIGLLAALSILVTGCEGPFERQGILRELNPAPMTAQAWSHIVGSYTGPVRESTMRNGTEGLSSMEIRLDLSGWATDPEAVFRMDKSYATAWTPFAVWKGTFTNIYEKRYGTQGSLRISTHAPDQILLTLRRNGELTGDATWAILTYRGNGILDVDWIGRSGWRGEGELWRTPRPSSSQ